MAPNHPFRISPDPTLLYVTPSLARSLDKVRYVIESRQGLTVIFGAVGLGKSTVMRYLQSEHAAREDCVSAFIPSPNEYKSEMQMLKAICGEFRLPTKRSLLDQQSELRRFLLELYRSDRNAVVFIDEAQSLRGPVLELMRSLLNFESNTHKLLQIVLCGQLELHAKLADPSKEALRSRIVLYSNLDPLTLAETEKMLAFRAERAGIPMPFGPAEVEYLYQLWKGVPRGILRHAGTALHLARRNRLDTVPAEILEMTVPDVTGVVAERATGAAS
jgi:general secretion pathway protein A